jgi:predicted CopG family antitoxin
MHRKLTITVADDVYRGLYRTVGRGSISRFIEDLVRPHVVGEDDLAAAYREAAADAEAEREANEWIEADLDDGWR